MEPVNLSSLESFEETIRKLEETTQQLASHKQDFEQVTTILL